MEPMQLDSDAEEDRQQTTAGMVEMDSMAAVAEVQEAT